MAWQILAMWAVAMVTIAWFVRGERQLIANATLAQAAFLYAPQRAPHDDYESDLSVDAPIPRPAPLPRRSDGLSRAERDFLKALSQTA
ncbi:hypothetical protein [Devosia beringensis]|uniref:hypothetical protein n=1 Tax=Devosia beringensis TaxID=2657486 RepID=UPI00186B77AC|nr:hypothetical protein [Devosia beringensis]